MAQFDVYPNPNRSAANGLPFVMEIQCPLFSSMPTCVVIPLAIPDIIDKTPVLRLNPVVQIGEQRLLAMTQELAAVNRKHLSTPVTNLAACRAELLAAIDLLFVGF